MTFTKVKPTAVSDRGLGYNVVLALTHDLQEQGYHIFTDSFYTSPILFLELHRRGLLVTGTVRPNRKGLPRLVKATKPARGQAVYARKGSLLVGKYCDESSGKDVCFLSTAAAGSDHNRLECAGPSTRACTPTRCRQHLQCWKWVRRHWKAPSTSTPLSGYKEAVEEEYVTSSRQSSPQRLSTVLVSNRLQNDAEVIRCCCRRSPLPPTAHSQRL